MRVGTLRDTITKPIGKAETKVNIVTKVKNNVALVATDKESGQSFQTNTKQNPEDQSRRDNAEFGTILQVVQNHGEP
ncbi:MAG: hypothetical protein OIF50_08080, partial [Flavobacteriaceae bacterium]|nr:hypothetical protein [Flavobacteriaceae bacterium]